MKKTALILLTLLIGISLTQHSLAQDLAVNDTIKDPRFDKPVPSRKPAAPANPDRDKIEVDLSSLEALLNPPKPEPEPEPEKPEKKVKKPKAQKDSLSRIVKYIQPVSLKDGELLTAPPKKKTLPKKALPIKQLSPQEKRKALLGHVPLQKNFYADGTPKTKAVLDYEESFDSLQAKYFPQEHAQKIRIQREKQRKLEEALLQKKLEAERTRIAREQQAQREKIKAKQEAQRTRLRQAKIDNPIPVPARAPASRPIQRKSSYSKPSTQSKLMTATAQKKQPQADPKVELLQIDEAGQLKKRQTAAKTQITKIPKIKGKKLVSIAYVDEEITLNSNVQKALKRSYIPKLKKDKNKRIALYSYTSLNARTAKDANRFALERALALKEFIVKQGIKQERIDVFPTHSPEGNSYSDWIDIVVQ